MELATDYMGLKLRNPLVASASPLSHTVDGIRRLADAGVGAVVLHSLFEEQLGRAGAPKPKPDKVAAALREKGGPRHLAFNDSGRAGGA
jgi:dihydroorotate dehydrogenase